MFYTIGNAYVGENKWYGIPKIKPSVILITSTASCYRIDDTLLADGDKVTIDNCRAAVQKAISTSDGSVNRWLKKAYDDVTDYVSTDDESSHYRDYSKVRTLHSTAINKERNGGTESDI